MNLPKKWEEIASDPAHFGGNRREAVMSALNLDESPKITGAPAEIWLCYGDVFATQTHADLNDQGVVLWCEDKQDHADIRYVRADALEEQAKRIVELESRLAQMEGDAGRLVKRLDSEIYNLCQKIGRKEDEGWEGSKRRHALHKEAAAFIASKEQTNG